jgi:hypothetical protein
MTAMAQATVTRLVCRIFIKATPQAVWSAVCPPLGRPSSCLSAAGYELGLAANRPGNHAATARSVPRKRRRTGSAGAALRCYRRSSGGWDSDLWLSVGEGDCREVGLHAEFTWDSRAARSIVMPWKVRSRPARAERKSS